VARGPTVRVEITRTPPRFAPVTENCAVEYRITGAATDATLEVRSRTHDGPLLFRRAGMPHAAGANRLEWAGQKTEGGAGHVGPHDSPLHLKIVCAPGGESPAAQVLVEVDSIVVTDGREGAHPERLMVAGLNPPEVEVTALVKLKRTSGPAVEAATPVGVDWTYEALRTNCPPASGGKGDTDTHWVPAPGFGDTPGGHAFARNFTNAQGQSKVRFQATRVAGDRWKLIARCLADPVARTGAVLARDEGRTYEVWREFTYSHFYRIPGGIDIDAVTSEAQIQPVFEPAFTLFHRSGTAQDVSGAEFTGEYLQDILPPIESELPRTSRIRVTSSGVDARVVTIRGKVLTTDAAGVFTGVADATEALTLNGAATSTATGTTRFLSVASVTTTPSAERALVVSCADLTAAAMAGMAPSDKQLDFIGRNLATSGTSAPVDDDESARTRAQAWADRNWHGIATRMRALATATSTEPAIYGARYLHPKHDGRSSTGITHYWAAFPDIRIRAQATIDYHPDGKWSHYLGWHLDNMSYIFLGQSDAHATTSARHEIAHASEHTPFGTGSGHGGASDHCGASSCLMMEHDGRGAFCTDRAHHSLHRIMGWLNSD